MCICTVHHILRHGQANDPPKKEKRKKDKWQTDPAKRPEFAKATLRGHELMYRSLACFVFVKLSRRAGQPPTSSPAAQRIPFYFFLRVVLPAQGYTFVDQRCSRGSNYCSVLRIPSLD